LIFVGGSPRSGTTLVQNILDSHPDVCGAPEFFCVPDIVEVRKNLHWFISVKWIDTICSYDDVDRSIARLIEDLLLPLADKQGRTFLSEKTPRTGLVFSELLNIFPAARFIHVVRDPRAVVASLLQVGKRQKERGRKQGRGTNTVAAAINHVKAHVCAGLAASAASPERVFTVIYEELVSNPETETKKLCQFLKIPWSEEMLYPSKKTHLGETAQTEGIWYTQETYNRDPEQTEINKWQDQLTPIQKVIITKAFRDIKGLKQLGYELSLQNFSPVSRGLGFTFSALQKGLLKAATFKHRLGSLASPIREMLVH
jgi:hypothetical protein